MPKTNSIGSGCRLLMASVPSDEHSAWGRLAHDLSAGRDSVAAWLKKFMVRGLRAELLDAEESGDLKRADVLKSALEKILETRKRYYGIALLMIFCGSILAHDQLRRPSRRGREEQIQMREMAT